MNDIPNDRQSRFRAPSARITAVLAAGMLAIGVVVGAAIGPAPTASFAVGRLASLLPVLHDLAARSSSTAVQPPAASPEPTPSAEPESSSARRFRRRRRLKEAQAATTPAATETSGQETTKPASTTPTGGDKKSASTLAPVTKVWLIELANSSFDEAAAQSAAGSYIDGKAVPSGTLLSGWSAIEGSAFANDATLIASAPPLADLRSVLDTIVQPACPASISDDDASGVAGAACAPHPPGTGNTPDAVAAADEFLEASLPTITSSAAYRENGLVVVTFASIVNATATGLPAGAASATLTSQPPTGVLLISPFVAAGARSSAAFDPTAPKQSLEKLLRR